MILRYGGILSSLLASFTGGTTGATSPSTFTSGHVYTSGRDMWVYTPPNYSGNSNNYPLIVFGHGYGQRSTNINDVLTDGLPQYLASGDEPAGVIICCPQIPSGDYTTTDWDNVLSYMTTNYRIDSNRVHITGLSGGGFWSTLVARERTSDIASTLPVAAGLGSGWVWSAQTEIAHFHIHGTNDGTVTNGLQSVLNSINAVTRYLPAQTLNLWNLGHNGTVWNTNCYNRAERTDAAGTATFDYVRYLKKQSKDLTQRAQLYVTDAEETLKIEDYRQALFHTNRLASGSTKTSLLSRLSTLKTTIDAGGRRFMIDFGTFTSSGNTNTMTAVTAGSTKSNLVDDNGGASTYGYTISTQHATAPASRTNDAGTRANGNYFGFVDNVYRDGIRVQGGVTGTSKFTGLNNSKAYKVRIYHTQAGSNTDRSRLSIVINGTTISQDSELNNTQYIEFTGITPSSGEIIMTAYPSGTGSPIRNSQISVIELFEPA